MIFLSMSVKSLDNTNLGFYDMAGSEKFRKVRVNVGVNGLNPYSQLSDVRSDPTGHRAGQEVTAEFLKGLPSFNENNFSRFQPDTSCRNNMRKPTSYFPTKDHPCEQIITTEKTTILLRYLQQQYERKKAQLKREMEKAGPNSTSLAPKKKSRQQNSQS